MTAARLTLLLLLILVAVVLVVLVLRRGSAQRDAHRVEAAGLRSEADTLATTMTGQTAFADQAAERAEVARVEAEAAAREAQRLEAEAAEHRAAVEATQRDYQATMRRADDIDPDVKESSFPAVPDRAEEPVAAAGVAGPADAAPAAVDAGESREADPVDRAHGLDETDGTGGQDDADADQVPMTRAERRQAREAGDPDEAAGAATSTWAARAEEEPSPESERIASAADFRDDVPAGASAEPVTEQRDVYPQGNRGSDADMSDNSRTESTEHEPDAGGLGREGAAASVAAGAGGGYAATRAMHDDAADESRGDGEEATPDGIGTARDADSTGRVDRDADLSRDQESPRGEWGGPRDDDQLSDTSDPRAESVGPGHTGDSADAADMTVISDPEAFATTEPVLAEDQTAPVTPTTGGDDAGSRETTEPDRDHHSDRSDHHVGDSGSADEAVSEAHAPAEAGAAVAETDGTDVTNRSAADLAEEPTEQRYDPTPTRDWAADEGELLEENQQRGERLESERDQLAGDVGDATGAPASGQGQERQGRRISDFHELRDGGYGVGSAAPLGDRAQPLDHPVQGFRESMTFRAPGAAGYDSAEPDVWFYDEGAAERHGFRRADG